LEPGLRILEAMYREQPHNRVEDAPHYMPVPRLVITDGAGRLAGANRDVEVVQLGWQEADDFLNRHGKVGVANKTVRATRGEHPGTDRCSFALCAFEQRAHVRHLVGEFLDDGVRAV